MSMETLLKEELIMSEKKSKRTQIKPIDEVITNLENSNEEINKTLENLKLKIKKIKERNKRVELNKA